MTDRPEEHRHPGPMTVALVVILGLAATLVPLIPEQYRPWNFAAFGALGMFAAARLGLGWGFALCVGGKVVSDLFNYAAGGYQAGYLPSLKFALPFVVYPLCGRLLRRSTHPLAIGGGAVAGSLLFFLVSNFGAWLEPHLSYPQTFAGLMLSYEAGWPFYRGGTLPGDVILTYGAFAAHAALARFYFPAEAVAPAPIPAEGDR